ncbi:MAG: AAA family ATPase [Oscillochloridaceae bacterium umkhey_bin13]
MNVDPANQPLLPFLPFWLRERIGTPELQPGVVYRGAATVLFADLSGFTRLTAAFATLPDGAERLHDALNRCYIALVETILACEGDVASIAGDALIAWWPGLRDLEHGRRCGALLLAAIAAIPSVSTPDGTFRLDLRIGVSAGLTYAVLAGLPGDSFHFTLCGPAVVAAATAERASAVGHILAVMAPALDPPAPPLQSTSPPVPLSWEHFLPPSFVERLRVGKLIAEYRRCVPVFASFALPPHPDGLHPLVAQVQAVVLRWGGWLNEIEVGDKGAVLVLLFGAPLARGDDPSRAVGCCIELRQRGLITRAGITLGWLFVGAVGSPQRRVYTAQGDDMNLAAHLMGLANPGDILISGRVRSDVIGRYRSSEPMLVQTKGRSEAVPVARVLVNERGRQRNGARLGTGPLSSTLPGAAVVGRTVERRTLLNVAEAAHEGACTALIVEGETGIGKSCLLKDLLDRWAARGRTAFSAECSSGTALTPLAAWQPILSALLNLDEAELPGSQQQHIAAALASLPPTHQAATSLLLQLLGLGGERPDSSHNLHSSELQHLFALVTALVTQRTQQEALLIVIEDIHWADELSLQLAATLLRSTPPRLCLVLSHRPLDELPAALVELRALPGCTRLSVSRLSGSEIHAMIREQLGVAQIHPDLGRHLERHTEGQPLFIREYLRVLRQRQLISVEEGVASLSRPAFGVQVSNSAQGIIQARVDQLDEATRLTLKVAAVLGPTFQVRLLATIHPAHPDQATLREHLQTLCELQIVDLELEGPEPVYRFKYGITHEVAYSSLLFGQRRILHTAVVSYYEQVHASEIETGTAPLAVYDALIYHLGHAQEQTRRAHYCQIAARLAARQFATGTALRYTEQALALTSAPERRFGLLLLRMAVNERAGSYLGQHDDLGELEQLAQASGDPLKQAYAAMFRLRCTVLLGARHQVQSQAPILLRQLHCMHEAPSLLTAASAESYAQARMLAGQARAARRILRMALTCAARSVADELALLTPTAVMVRCLNNLGSLALHEGQSHEAMHQHTRALDLASGGGDWSSASRAQALRGWSQLVRGATDAALADARMAWTASTAVGDRYGQALALRLLAATSAKDGAYDAAERDAHFAASISARAGMRHLEAEIWQDLVGYALAQGQLEAAEGARQERERALRMS